MNRCLNCFKEYNDELDVCPYCGALRDMEPKEPIDLMPGTLLNGRYIIGRQINAGGFGIMYKAWDTKLDIVVAVKEFFCSRLVTRATGESEVIVAKKEIIVAEYEYRLARFLDEARNLAKFSNSKYIPNVFEYFTENGTAYIIMELLQGEDMGDYIAHHGGKVDIDFALRAINDVGAALMQLHEKGIIHRDVAPDNIYVDEHKEATALLIDLGAAWLPDGEDVIDLVMKPGYSPPEQYTAEGKVGVWFDIYALGATLYAMITGVKPEESTNRKTQDDVVPPMELDPSIPENLSNSIMKAMAIESHMRFKSVAEFLKAINGEKKVLTLAKEKKRRKRRRFSGIAAACLVLALVGGMVWHEYDNKRSEQILKDASISVWFSVEDGSSEEAAMQSITEDFRSKFENVTVELKGIPAAEYEQELEKAAGEGKLPTLFESTGISDDILKKAQDVDSILKTSQAKNCLFLDQYGKYYKDHKRLPLAIKAPMAGVITNGVTSVDYEKSFFSKASDFGTDAIAIDPDCEGMYEKNMGTSSFESEETFLDNDANSSAVLLTTTMGLNEIREMLTNYSKTYVFYKADKIYCDYTYEWSIGGGSHAETAAAERLLSWMLGNAYQNTLMISGCSDGQLPVNKTCFEEKIKAKNLTPIDEVYRNYLFER